MFTITSCFVLIFIVNIAAAPRHLETPKLSLGIVGGQEANRGEFPYQVSYQMNLDVNQWFHLCGGSIINENWIVLAAHCVESNVSLSDYRVAAGILKLNDTGIETMQVRSISNQIVHEDFPGPGHSPNDIVLIKLASPLIFNEDIQAISLPSQNLEVAGTGTVTGWGQSDPLDFDGANTLQKATGVPFINSTMCKNLLDNVGQAAPSPLETGELSLGIVGGQNASRGEFPYQISYQILYGVNGVKLWLHYCGGSIINETWIVTAAHCVDINANLSNFRVVAGILNLNDTGIETMQVKNISTQIVHEDFLALGRAPSDIALIQLETPLIFNEDVQPISLPTLNFEVTGNGTVTGWGQTDVSDNGGPDTLQKAEVPFINATECQKIFDDVGQGDSFDGEITICTGPRPTENVSPCFGDSGGPLAQNGTLIGIVSRGDISCNTQNSPALYTKVSHFISWIVDKTNGTLSVVYNLS